MNLSKIISRKDIIRKKVELGDLVMYYTYSAETRSYTSHVGIAVKETDEGDWIVNGKERLGHQILFVLTVDAYNRQKRFSNPHAI